MAAGKPVIGVAEGGLLETILDGETGILVRANPGPQHVAEAVRAMTPERGLVHAPGLPQPGHALRRNRVSGAHARPGARNPWDRVPGKP